MALEQDLATARLRAHEARQGHDLAEEARWNEHALNLEARLILRDNPWDELKGSPEHDGRKVYMSADEMFDDDLMGPGRDERIVVSAEEFARLLVWLDEPAKESPRLRAMAERAKERRTHV